MGVFVVATIVGYKLINNVPSLLHTPLMSGMNALSGITVLGALTASAIAFNKVSLALSLTLGVLAIALAMVNVIGGFVVTNKMLKMIAKDSSTNVKLSYSLLAVGSLIVLGAIVGLNFVDGEVKTYLYYGLCALLSIGILVGIAFMSKVKKAVLGNRISAICLFLGIALTLVYNAILPAWTLYVGIALGVIVGLIMAEKVQMIQMPQMVALLNGLGGAASAIVGGFAMFGIGTGLDYFSKTTSALAFAIGMLTLTGSLVAAGKLHKILPQKPIIYKGHQFWTMASLILTLVAVILYIVLQPLPLTITIIAIAIFVLAGFFGYIFAIRVGGADMPITISLLNSLSGVAGAIAGLAINDLLLVAIGGIVGASGLLLTQIMCKAMNRKIGAILLGATSAHEGKKPVEKAKTAETAQLADNQTQAETTKADEKTIENSSEENTVVEEKAEVAEEVAKVDPIEVLKNAKSVIIVPGYGMAIAQAQHLVKQLADKLVEQGSSVKYAIHPVAGRMPGHMNVLLCEANVEYEDLYEMQDVNPEFATADATIVIGANDVLNPAAREAEGTPIYGMPILSVDKCKNIFIFNYDLKPGYAGVENPLYTRKEGVYLYLGNARETLKTVLTQL